MADVLQYPLVHRKRLIASIAHRMAELPDHTAERHLANQLRIQRETMERRGVAPVTIAREIRSLESAVRAVIGACFSHQGAQHDPKTW
jgi:hypothetical protein